MMGQPPSPKTRPLASPVCRLRMLGTILVVAASSAWGTSAVAQIRAATDAGVVEGKLSSDGLVAAYLGVRYAAPPVGSLRWKKPQKVAQWRGVRDAKEFGPHCMQPPIFEDMRFRDGGQSEDCLTLNIWTPLARTENGLPGMVWPSWPRYAAADWQVLHLDASAGETISHAEPDLHRDRYVFLAQVWGNTPLPVTLP